MGIEILAAVAGLLIAAAAITIPRVISHRNDPENVADSRAYLKETGRSARDIAQGNAEEVSEQENDAGSQQVHGSDGPSPRRLRMGRRSFGQIFFNLPNERWFHSSLNYLRPRGGPAAALRRRTGDGRDTSCVAMPSGPTRTAVCLLRVEVESWGLVITMTVKRDIANANAERVTRFSSTAEAAAAVTAFLESCDRAE